LSPSYRLNRFNAPSSPYSYNPPVTAFSQKPSNGSKQNMATEDGGIEQNSLQDLSDQLSDLDKDGYIDYQELKVLNNL
jgi:hypothetical protein